MIQRSFIILPRIGQRTEQNLWQHGITDWDAFRARQRVPGVSGALKAKHDRLLCQAKEQLYAGNSGFFLPILPRVESWRLYDFFKDETVYIDIETSFDGDITVVGLFDGDGTKTMVKGINLDARKLKEYLARFKLMVTFNGASFDLPILNRYYPGCIPSVPHLDLRHACARIGLHGGLKSIEKQVGIHRDDEVVNVVGSDAPMLWRYFKATGDEHYLQLLVKYNDEDTVNLERLAGYAVQRLETAAGLAGGSSAEKN
ncbi:MAG: ribonuclease H-like domain-containing protein [Nanoarchaeota archaeon]